MKHIAYLFLLGFLGIFSTACQKVIIIDLPPHEPKLVVRCNIDEGDSVLVVWVAQTVGILDTQYIGDYDFNNMTDSTLYASSNWVSNASINIFENGNLLATLQPVPHLRIYRAYLTQPIQSVGKTYELQVVAPGFDNASASLSFPSEPTITDIRYEPNSVQDQWGSTLDKITFKLQDPVGTGNYYKIQIWSEHTDTSSGETFSYANYLSSSNPVLEVEENGIVMSDIGFDGENYEVSFMCYSLDTTFSTNTMHVIGINRDQYFFSKSLRDYYGAAGNPFAEPVVLYTNINNGRGLFSGSVRKKFLIL